MMQKKSKSKPRAIDLRAVHNSRPILNDFT